MHINKNGLKVFKSMTVNICLDLKVRVNKKGTSGSMTAVIRIARFKSAEFFSPLNKKMCVNKRVCLEV